MKKFPCMMCFALLSLQTPLVALEIGTVEWQEHVMSVLALHRLAAVCQAACNAVVTTVDVLKVCLIWVFWEPGLETFSLGLL